jgi:CelD/BcsL family acetyltransferase involved in cellulose biosynthesis
MRTECLTKAEEAFQTLRSAWSDLLTRSATNTTFLEPFWQADWWDAYGEGKALCVITVRDDEDQLVGIAPLFRHERQVSEDSPLPPLSIERPESEAEGVSKKILHPIGGTELSDYLDWIVDKDVADAVYEAIWVYLTEEMDEWDLLDLHCIPEGSPTLERLPELAKETGYQTAVEQEEVCPIVDLPDDWSDYLDSLDSKQGREIRRKDRRAKRMLRVDWRKHGEGDDLEADIELFIRLHKASDPEKAAFWDEGTTTFFREVVRDLAKAGVLELSFIYFNDEPMATLLCFTHDRDMLVYNSGYVADRYRSLSSGLLLLSYVIKDAIERDMDHFDFLRGDERYKYDYGGVDKPIYRLGIAPAE